MLIPFTVFTEYTFFFFAQQVIIATWDKSASEKNHWCKKLNFPVDHVSMLELTEATSVVNSVYGNQAQMSLHSDRSCSAVFTPSLNQKEAITLSRKLMSEFTGDPIFVLTLKSRTEVLNFLLCTQIAINFKCSVVLNTKIYFNFLIVHAIKLH